MKRLTHATQPEKGKVVPAPGLQQLAFFVGRVMAGDWIKMRANLHSHPKVVRMASALNADRLRIVGGLHAVWCLFDEHAEDGQLHGYDADTVDSHISFPGFAAAMESVSWLLTDGLCVTLPRFEEHNGQSAKRRAMEAQRKRSERQNPVRNLSAPHADVVRTREEKRREEKIEDRESVPRKRVTTPVLQKPEDVTDSTWADWLQLRKTKRAPVTETVIEQAKAEALKAGIPLQRFLEIWCMRGSQGLQADWLRTDERPGRVVPLPARMHDNAEETARMLAERDSLAAEPSPEIREQIARLRGKRT